MRNKAIIFLSLILVAALFITSFRKGKKSLPATVTLGDMAVIMIDPGHGGPDPGAVSEGIREADINLQISLKLGEILAQKGFCVLFTRKIDEGLPPGGNGEDIWQKTGDMGYRKKTVLESSACLFLSIHQNSYKDSSVGGAQIWYSECNEENKILAQCLQARLNEACELFEDRAPQRRDELIMLKDNPMPSALVECGFITNFKERNLLSSEDYQLRLAQALAEGIMDYLKGGEII